ncbi:spore germination protein [Pontibacillus litoralis]
MKVKKIEDLKKRRKKNKDSSASVDKSKTTPLHHKLEQNVDELKQSIGASNDVVIKQFYIGKSKEKKCALVFIDGLVDKTSIQEFILESMMVDYTEEEKDKEKKSIQQQDFSSSNMIEQLKQQLLPVSEVEELADLQTLYDHVFSGDTILLLDESPSGLIIGTREWKQRAVMEPSSQMVVRGPRDGFTETLRTNTMLIRRRIKDKNLRLESHSIGKVTKTDVTMMYLEGIVNDGVVKEVRERLKRIDTDAILESGYIEEFIQDEAYTPFPTVYNSERPDTIAAGILEGRVAILVDGTPFVLLVPALFVQFFQSSEDYYHRTDIVIAVRLLRYFAFFLSLLTPSIYIAVTTFHHEMLPTPLLISLAAQREGVPFPAFIEALLMVGAFEILHEAGIRMPRAVGSAISIVGALVLGEAAVQAGLVSAVMVIVVALTAISSFVSPSFNMGISVRLIRVFLMILASIFGLFGIILGLIVMVLHLCSLRSFGIPYMSPLAPLNASNQKDAILRLPHWSLLTRPHLISQKNVVREQTVKKGKPKPPTKNREEGGSKS